MGVGETLRCMSPEDVYLHLKSSDFVTHDLDHAYDDCEDDDGGEAAAPPTAPQTFHLILKKWFSMPKSHEFRCFVRQGKLIGKHQRQLDLASLSCRFAHGVEPSLAGNSISAIQPFRKGTSTITTFCKT